MKVIVGLGNPGSRYEKTRHNAGFWVIDYLSKAWNIPLTGKKFNAILGQGMFAGKKVILVQPQTYMNKSGESVRKIVDYWQVDLRDLMVIFDDLSLPPAQIRLKAQGSSGGHRGVQNIIDLLGTNEFPRLRIGIGATPDYMDTVDYVLANIPKSEWEAYQEAVIESVKAIELWMELGIDQAMNRFNVKKDRP
ncbi:MAG: aminoacyl-tRNA hydrolase [Firmicutes bacterium]|nr:aminoacyl-tRNA hydrolase [Bacillota bacterium]